MGNSQTRPSANTAIEYEEDKSIIEMLNFTILEAPSEQHITSSSILASPASTRSTGERLRQFSTFQSAAARPSVSSSDSYNRLRLTEILANGVPLATEPGEYNGDQLFLRRLAHYEFNLKIPIKNMRILFCKNLDDSLFSNQQLGETIENAIRMKPNLRIMGIGDKMPSTEPNVPVEAEQEIYIPERSTGPRRLYVFIVHGEGDLLLVKARAVLMDEGDAERITYIGAHMEERDEKIQTLVKKITGSSTIMKLYNTEELTELYQKISNTPKPPAKYLMGIKDALLAFRIYEPANRDSIVANLVLVATDSTFLEYVCAMLASIHPVRVILMDLRGFGYSGGKRGHTPTVKTLFGDIKQVIRHVRGFSTKPVLLGGFLFSGGIVVNYEEFEGKEPVDGYLLISPILGIKWKSAWRPEMKDLSKDGAFSRRKGWYLMNKLTGGRIGGSKYVIDMKVDEETFEFSPMHYGRMTANYVRAFQVPDPATFSKLSAPMAIFLAEKDEHFQSELIREKIEPQLKGESKFFLVKSKSGLGMLLSMADDIANWITSLSVVKPWALKCKKPRDPFISMLDLATVKALIPSSIYASIEKGVETHVYDRAPRQTDCHYCKKLTYDQWEPSYLPGRPVGVMLLIASRCQAHFMGELAEKYRFMIFRLNAWHRDGCKATASPKIVWRAMQEAIKVIKANNPAAPFFIGGVGYGASVALGYSKYENRAAVNGYILIAPPIDIYSSANVKFKKEGVEKSSDPSLIMFNEPTPKMGNPSSEQAQTLARTGYIPHLVKDSSSMYLSKDFIKDIKALDAPAAVFLPTDHSFIDNEKLFKELEGILKSPFQLVERMRGDLYNVLEDINEPLGNWAIQLGASVAPRIPLQLRHSKLQDFEPIEMIGKGTFGKVWLVRHTSSSRFCALKVLDKEMIVKQKQVKQVVRERQVLASCGGCPFIVNFVGSFQDSQRLYLAMEFLIGGELFTRLNKLGKLSTDATRFYICEVIVALDYLHEREIVYRDLKPENIVLDAMGHVRLVDFGFARKLERGRCGSFCGSPYYIAPEMLSNSQYGKSVDIWALGVLLFELITGGPPFSGQTANEVYRRILFSTLAVPNNLDTETRDLLTILLDPSPDTRIGSKKGMSEVMKHKWFKGIDWDRVRSKQLPPPYQPNFGFEGDTSNFVKFAGMTFEDLDEIPDKHPGLFEEF